MRARAALLALVLGLGLAGCGGDDEPAVEEAPPAETEEPAPGGEATGRELFVANCGTCHTLADAGTSGTVGPSFDDFSPAKESVEAQVRSGGGGMPSFEGTLTDEEIDAVSTYVAENAGG